MSKIIKVRKGAAADKPLLSLGEFGWDLDTEQLFIGGNSGNVRIGATSNSVDVKEYGAIGDGVTDDSQAIQDAVNYAKDNGGMVYFSKGSYFIETTILLPSNITLYSDCGATLKSKVIEPAFNGAYSQRVFQNDGFIDGNNNIIINGLVFDGNRDSATQPAGAYDFINSLVYFENVEHMLVENCVFKKHISNWRVSESALPFYGFSAVCFNNCTDVDFINNESYDHRTEGIFFHECDDVNIDRLYSNLETTWTSLHAWYCDGVVLQNSYIFENNNTGSSLNMYSTNMTIFNNQILGGGGLDIGNERDTIFNIENIYILNNKIVNSAVHGIYGAPSELKKHIVISGNYIESVEQPVRPGLIEDLVIENNKIISTGVGFAGIKIAENVDRMVIESNYIDASNCIFIGNARSDEIYKNIKILNNVLESQPLDGLSSFSYGAGVMIKSASSIIDNTFINIEIIGNTIKAEGSFVYTELTADPLKAEKITVKDNNMYSDTISCDRAVFINKFKWIIVENNTFDGFDGNTFGGENVYVKNNKFFYSLGVATDEAINFTGAPTGIAEIVGNIAEDETLTLIRGSHAFTKYRIEKNIPDTYYSDVLNTVYGTTAERPPNPERGQMFFDETIDKPIFWDWVGGNWILADGTTA